jgi:hypothetical protein
MTITFESRTDHHREDWESALLAAAVRENTELDPLQHKRLLRVWLPGLFNGAASGVDERQMASSGGFQWVPAGPEHYQLIWHAPYGVPLVLAKVYRQENGSYAAIVVAGVKEEAAEAMQAAQWAIARLSSE